jgi:hypothetical protein
MKQQISICKRNENGSLTITDEKKLNTELNEQEMEVYAKYHGKSYKIEGNINMFFIVVE